MQIQNRLELSDAVADEVNKISGTTYTMDDLRTLENCITDIDPDHPTCVNCAIRTGCATIMAEQRVGMINVRTVEPETLISAIRDIKGGKPIPISFSPVPKIAIVPKAPPAAVNVPPPPPAPSPPVPLAKVSPPSPPPPPVAAVPAVPKAATPSIPDARAATKPESTIEKLDPNHPPDGFEGFDRDQLIAVAELVGLNRKADIGKSRAPTIVEMIYDKMPGWKRGTPGAAAPTSAAGDVADDEGEDAEEEVITPKAVATPKNGNGIKPAVTVVPPMPSVSAAGSVSRTDSVPATHMPAALMASAVRSGALPQQMETDEGVWVDYTINAPYIADALALLQSEENEIRWVKIRISKK